MKLFKRAVLVGLVAVFASLISLRADAGDPFRKLGRGIVNVGAGILEIPVKVYDVNKEEGGLAAVTYGALKGIGFFVAREMVGAAEVVTFPIPLPGATDSERDSGWGYGTLMEPEWIIGPEHDVWNIIYQDLPVK